jgi:hypothetical protein
MKRSLIIGSLLAVPLAVRALAFRRSTPKPIEEQVRDGLRGRDGWWVRRVLEAFDYLVTDFGYSLDEVQMHFKGNSVVYRGPVFLLHIDYDPEATRSIGAELWVAADVRGDGVIHGAPHPRALDVNAVLRARSPDLRIPDTMPTRLTRDLVSDAIEVWARGLRELAPDVLRGTWPEGVAVRYLW